MLFFSNILQALQVYALAGLLYLWYNSILKRKIMQKIVISDRHGGFGLSDEAMQLYKILTGIAPQANFYDHEIPRDSSQLVQIVEQLGERANGKYSRLKVVEVPVGVEWHISEYDGSEWVAENHRTWY